MAYVDPWIRHSVFLDRYKSGQVKDITRFLRQSLIPDILKKSNSIAKRMSNRRSFPRRRRVLMQQLRGLDDVVRGGTNLLRARLKNNMSELAKAEASWTAETMQRQLPLRLGYKLPAPQLLNAIVTTDPMNGRFLKEWTDTIAASTSKRIRQQIMLGIAQGESTTAIMSRLKSAKGVLKMTVAESQMVTRTAVNHVQTKAREAVIAENSQAVDKVEWLSTLDSRTSQICASLDGLTWSIHAGPRPPAHPNCRSDIIPVLKPLADIPGVDVAKVPASTRAAAGGPVPGKTTFGQWLKKQPPRVQNEVLGNAGKGDVFRRGHLPIKQFSDVRGLRPLTLKEVLKKERNLLKGGLKSAPGPVALSSVRFELLEKVRSISASSGLSGFEFQASDLAEFLVGRTPSTVRAHINYLVKNGFLEKTGRGKFRLTAFGKEADVTVGKVVKRVTRQTPPAPTTTKPPPSVAVADETGEQLRLRLLEQSKLRQESLDFKRSIQEAEERYEGLLAEQKRAYATLKSSGRTWSEEYAVAWKKYKKQDADIRRRITEARAALREAREDATFVRGQISTGGTKAVKTTEGPKGERWRTSEDHGVTHTHPTHLKQRTDEAVEFVGNLWRRSVTANPETLEQIKYYKERIKSIEDRVKEMLETHGRKYSTKWWSSRKAQQQVYADGLFDPDTYIDLRNQYKRDLLSWEAKATGHHVEVSAMKDSARAFATRGKVYVAKVDPVRTIIHEIGHTIEDANYSKIAYMFRAYRANVAPKGAPFELPPVQKMKGYKDEYAWADKFESAYTGKVYDFAGTEITSMYTEQLYAAPLRFMKNDPEGFDFIIDLMRGVPVSKMKWYRNLSSANKKFLDDLDWRGIPKDFKLPSDL